MLNFGASKPRVKRGDPRLSRIKFYYSYAVVETGFPIRGYQPVSLV